MNQFLTALFEKSISNHRKFCILFIYLFILFQCNPEKNIPNDELYFGIASDPNSIDPIFSIDSASQKINRLVFKKLFNFSKDGILIPDLIEKYSANGNSLNLELKSSILTANDVLYSLNRLRTDSGPRKNLYSNIKNIKILSDREVFIQYENFQQKDLENLTLASASIYKEINFKKNAEFVSDGLFTLKEWKKNDFMILDRNSENKNLPKQIKIQVLSDPSSAIYLYKKNILDLMKIPYYLLSDSFYKILAIKGKSLQYIAINHTNPCFDKNFRKALNHSIDRNLILDKIFSGYAEQVNTSIPNPYLEKISSKKYYYEYNLEKAKEFLSQSKCFPKIFQEEIDFRMRADDENKAKGLTIAKYLTDLGLTVKINRMEKIKLYKENSEKKGDLTLLTWYIDFDSIENFIDPIFALDQFGSGGNRSFYSDEILQKKILKLRSKKYSDLDLIGIIERLYEEAPVLFLWSIDETYVLSKKAEVYQDLIDRFIN